MLSLSTTKIYSFDFVSLRYFLLQLLVQWAGSLAGSEFLIKKLWIRNTGDNKDGIHEQLISKGGRFIPAFPKEI
jgi:hypothetical protein